MPPRDVEQKLQGGSVLETDHGPLEAKSLALSNSQVYDSTCSMLLPIVTIRQPPTTWPAKYPALLQPQASPFH